MSPSIWSIAEWCLLTSSRVPLTVVWAEIEWYQGILLNDFISWITRRNVQMFHGEIHRNSMTMINGWTHADDIFDNIYCSVRCVRWPWHRSAKSTMLSCYNVKGKEIIPMMICIYELDWSVSTSVFLASSLRCSIVAYSKGNRRFLINTNKAMNRS